MKLIYGIAALIIVLNSVSAKAPKEDIEEEADDKPEKSEPAKPVKVEKPAKPVVKLNFKEADYLIDFIDTLMLIKKSYERYGDMPNKPKEKGNIKYWLEFATAARTSKTDLAKAREIMIKYKNWDNPGYPGAAKTITDSILDIIGLLADPNELIIESYTKCSEAYKMKGAFVKSCCDFLKDRDTNLPFLSKCAEISIRVLMEDKADEKGKHTILCVTKADKERVEAKLLDAFGNLIKEERKEENIKNADDRFLFCGAVLYKELKKEWTYK